MGGQTCWGLGDRFFLIETIREKPHIISYHLKNTWFLPSTSSILFISLWKDKCFNNIPFDFNPYMFHISCLVLKYSTIYFFPISHRRKLRKRFKACMTTGFLKISFMHLSNKDFTLSQFQLNFLKSATLLLHKLEA